MIELDSIIVILMIEGLFALLLVIVALYLFSSHKSKGDQLASNKVIARLKDTGNLKAKKLTTLVATNVDIEPAELNEILAEMKSSERQLYKQIIQLYLKRDVDALANIDQQIDRFSEPYFKVLAHSVGGAVDTETIEEYEKKNYLLMEQNDRLGEQLSLAMATIDEISSEYSKVFSGTQTELELKNSSKKMLGLFQQASQKMATTANNTEGELL